MKPPTKATPWDLRCNIPECTILPPGRKHVDSAEGRLAHALIEGALIELRSSQKELREQATAWFLEPESMRIASLGWCCSVLSLTLGEVISPARLAKAALLWQRPTPKARVRQRATIHTISQ